jgi:thioesterase domain-containing protein/acyl carrier protein
MQPAALVRLATFTLNANGKVDRAALPSPEALSAGQPAGEAGLRTADERAMADLWAEVLSITGIGGHDHFFFDLAGNSLLAAQVIDRVNRRFGVKLSMHDLLTTPTVVSLTAKVTKCAIVNRAAVPHLEVVRNGRGYDPVVCVGFSNVLPVLQAALAADVPLWWLKLDGLHGPPYAVRPVAEIASGYADELSAAGIRRVTLVGHSYCGLIAFDLTRRLRRAGMTVHTLLLEPSLPEMFARGHQGMPDDPRLAAATAKESLIVQTSRLRRLLPTAATLRSCGIWLAEKAKRRAQKSLLRPYLKFTVRLGRELPPRHRQWWYYGSQIMRRIKQFEILRSPGPFWLAGQSAYLTTYADSWQAHVDGELAQCPLPAARCHAEVLEQPAAAAWLAVVRSWAEGMEPAGDGSLDRVAA